MTLSESAENFIEAVRENIRTGERKDGRGEPVEDLNEDEAQALRDFMMRLSECDGEISGLHCTLELGAGVRKAVLTFFGLVPLLRPGAENSGKGLVHLSATSQTESRARNDQRLMFILTPVECETWDSAALLGENGELGNFWIIGDLDWGETPGDTERIRKGISMSHMADACILLHRAGEKAIVDPATAGKAGCLSLLIFVPLLCLLLSTAL